MRRVLLRIAYGLVLVLVTGFIASMLVRLSPGFGVDERELDSSLSSASIERIRAEHATEPGLVRGYAHYLAGVVLGDWGESQSLNRPVKELVRERVSLTARTIGVGLGEALLLSMIAATLVTLWRNRLALAMVELSAGILVCLPAAVLGLLLYLKEGTPSMALALALVPRLYRFFRDVLASAARAPHVLAAHSRGISPWRVFFMHIVRSNTPELIATIAVSIPLALSACVAVEVIFDSPGLGQLAWQAAMARDLVLMINLTVIIAAATIVAGMIADFASPREQRS